MGWMCRIYCARIWRIFRLLLGEVVIENLLNEIVSHGDRGAVVPNSRIDDLKQDMADLRNGEYHTMWIDWMAGNTDEFIPSDLAFEPRSLIVVARPTSKALLQFNYGGKPVYCTVPPGDTDEILQEIQVLRYINDYLQPLGFSAAMAVMLPKKLLAVHCGLGRYGRNNICYNAELGSFMQILTYVSDIPCDEATWFPISRMEACENCNACVTACPTGAIDSSRHLINAERCITAINEFPGEFPEWLDKSAHNSLLGCMKCQDCCPGNAMNQDNVTTNVTFTEEETAELLNHSGDEPCSDSLTAKLEAAGISTWINVLPRNLAALLLNGTHLS